MDQYTTNTNQIHNYDKLIIINHALLKVKQLPKDQYNQKFDIILNENNYQTYIVLVNGKSVIEHLHYFTSHKYQIILYGEPSALDQLKTIIFLKDYAKKNNFTINITGIICPGKVSGKAIDQGIQIKKLEEDVLIF